MVEYHTAEGVIDSFIQIVARLTPTDGFANDFRYRRRGRSDEEPTWLGKDFDRLGEKTTDLGVDRCRQPSEGRHGVVILPRQESFASLHILTRRASEGSEALPSLARRVSMCFFGARVIVCREAATDVEQLGVKPAQLGLGKDAGGEVQRLHVILGVSALASDMKAHSLGNRLRARSRRVRKENS